MKVIPKKSRLRRHGTWDMYSNGCRCRPCRYNASAKRQAERVGVLSKGQRTPALVTTRQLRAMQVMGWSTTHIGAATAIPIPTLHWLLRGKWTWVDASYAKAIDAFYWRHEISHGPGRSVAGRSRSKRWIGPFEWDDITDTTERVFRDKNGYLTRRWVDGTKTDRDQGSSPAA